MTQAFNLSQFANKVNSSGQADLTSAVTGILPVANGGTGASSLTANNVILGNGTSAVQLVAPGTSGNVLTSDGTGWVSAAGGGYGGFSTVIFSSSTTWSVPAGITRARITVIGGGGGSNIATPSNKAGNGGMAVAYCTSISGTLTITIGAGGASANTGGNAPSGGTSSITGTGVSVSATGGVGAAYSGTNQTAASGSGSVSTGTALANHGSNQQPQMVDFLNVGAFDSTSARIWSSSGSVTPGLGATSGSAANVGAYGIVMIEY